MTILFMGGEMTSYIPATASVGEGTDSFNSSFCRGCMSAYYTADYYESLDYGTGTDLYIHMDLALGGYAASAGTGNRFVWLNGAGVEKIALATTSNNTLTLQYHNGTSWVSVGSITINMGTRQTLDLRAKVNSASGLLKLYVSGTERIDSGTVDLSGITSLGKHRFYGLSVSIFGSNTLASQVIIADEPTIGMRLITRYPNTAGASTDWTGGYTDIDELAYNDGDFVNSGTANQVSTFGQTGPGISGYNVRAVGVYARARCGGGGPQNLQLALRSAGTNYFSASKTLDVGYRAFGNIWETNPATSADWLNTAVDSLQPGVKSIT